MLIRAYFPQILTALFGGLFVAAGIITFGDAKTFDRLYLVILIFTAIVCRENINVVSIVFILFLQVTIDEIVWLTLGELYIFKIFSYSFVLWSIYYFRYDWVIKIILPSVTLVAGSEFYWYFSNYQPPQISWYIWIMSSNLIIRYLIFSRVRMVDKFFPEKGASINLDWIIYKLSALTILVQAGILMEYLARHVLGYSNVLLVYFSYPYIIQGIATLSIWAVFNESYKLLVPRLLKA
jgi:hypothetical protein